MNTEDKIAELTAEIARLNATIAWYQGQAGQRIGEAARAGIAGATVRGAGSIDTPDFRILSFAYADAIMHGTVPQSSAAWAALVAHINHHAACVAGAKAEYETTELSQEVARLQNALCFWLPSVTDREDEVADRILEDAFLLVGCDGNMPEDFKTAQELGWIVFADAAAPAAPLPELTGPSAGSIGEDATFDDLLADYKLAESRSSYAKALAALVAYIDSRSAASPSPAPAQPTGPHYEEQPDGTITEVDQSDLFGAAPAQQQWINVDDRLPEAEMSVLVMAPEWERPCIAAHFPGDEMNRAEWQDDSGEEIEPPPTAWMQLPEFSASPVSRVGGITNKESAEPAAPGASIGDKQ